MKKECIKKEEKYSNPMYEHLMGKTIKEIEHNCVDDTCLKYGGDGHARYEEIVIHFTDNTICTIASGMEAHDGIHQDTEIKVSPHFEDRE